MNESKLEFDISAINKIAEQLEFSADHGNNTADIHEPQQEQQVHEKEQEQKQKIQQVQLQERPQQQSGTKEEEKP